MAQMTTTSLKQLFYKGDIVSPDVIDVKFVIFFKKLTL